MNPPTPQPSPRPLTPHKLDLYRLAVQQPQAMVHWLCNAYATYHPGQWARRLREDFAGNSALSMAWVEHDYDHTAHAVDLHAPTLRWAQARARRLAKAGRLDPDRLSFQLADVTDPSTAVDGADLIAAMNFSINIYHNQADLLAYFQQAYQNLSPGGLLVIDLFGGPGAQRTHTQRRRVKPPVDSVLPAVAPFEYQWEQADIDHVTGLITCRIHFKTREKFIKNTFVYHWRLWSAPELLDTLAQAGFEELQVWSSPQEVDSERQSSYSSEPSGGLFEPVERIGPCEDFLAYITAMKP